MSGFVDSTEKKESQIDDHEIAIERIQRARNLWYLNPTDFIAKFWEFLSLWWESRNWKSISVIVPPLILLFGLSGLVLIGKLRSKDSLQAWYQDQAVALVNQLVKSRKEGSEPHAQDVAKVELLLKRVLQLGNENIESRFFVAQQNLALGRLDVARRMIERISPGDRPGLPLGHVWMAKDLLTRASKGEPVSADVLKHHLQHSLEKLGQNVDAELYMIYASMLDRDNKTSDAARYLTKAGEVEPSLQLKVIEYFLQRNLPNQAKGSADNLIDKLSEALKQKDRNEQDKARDVVLVARAYTLTGRIEESIAILNNHSPNQYNRAEWRRCMSDNYRTSFRKSIVKSDQSVQVNLNYLNAAIAADPTNLSVQTDLALLHELGIASTPERRQSLVTLIAQEGNSIVPKLMLAQSAFFNEDLQGAISYYELILAELPELTLALNNVAALYSRITPANLERATELIDKALQISPRVSDFHDTKGDIDVKAGRSSEAVKNYLLALELDPERRDTRQKLIQQYLSTGNEEEAAKQKELVERWEQERQKRESNSP
jgi:tetratricopeptide (TPR) repeat protein